MFAEYKASPYFFGLVLGLLESSVSYASDLLDSRLIFIYGMLMRNLSPRER